MSAPSFAAREGARLARRLMLPIWLVIAAGPVVAQGIDPAPGGLFMVVGVLLVEEEDLFMHNSYLNHPVQLMEELVLQSKEKSSNKNLVLNH